MSSKSSAKKSKPVPGAARRAAGRRKTAGSGPTPTSGDRLPIVGLGASAGDLEAPRAVFGAMRAKRGLSCVVAEQLDPTHQSLIPELLARSTTPGSTKRNRQPLEADHVYIIPPNRALTFDQELIGVREVADRRGVRGSIDHSFRSLADHQHEGAIGVMSGTATEGP